MVVVDQVLAEQPLSQPPQPLLGSVLAVLKAATEAGHHINRTKLAKLL
jgi:hypothetical protein